MMELWRGLKFWFWVVIFEANVHVYVLDLPKVMLIFPIPFRFAEMMAVQLERYKLTAMARKAVKPLKLN